MKKVSLLVLICMLLSLVCTSCSLMTEQHEHSYSSSWSFDATNHYKACNCGEKSESAAHADADNDGACDVCAIIMSNNHVFDTAWTSDASSHWHAALCGHDLVDGKADHTPDALGKCTACGYVVSTPATATIAEALATAAIANANVRNGLIESTHSYFNGDYMEKRYEHIWYEAAENYLHTFATGDRVHHYISLDKDGEVFDLRIENDGYTVVETEPSEFAINGYHFTGEFVDDYSAAYYGVNDLVSSLYAAAKENANGDFVEKVENGVYSFSYGVFNNSSWDPAVFVVTVEFTLDADYFINNMTLVSEKYIKEGSVYDPEMWDFVEVTDNYTEVTDGETTKYVLSENALSSSYYAYTVEQSSDIINTHKPEDIYPSSYKLVDAEGNEIDLANGVSMDIGKLTLEFADVEPSTALIDAIGVDFVATDAEGNSTWSVYGGCSDGKLDIVAGKVGTYNITITIGKDTINFVLTVNYKAPDSLAAGVEGDYDITEAETANVYVNSDLLIAGVVGDGCNPAITASVTSANADKATLTEATVNGLPGYAFNATEAGEYTVVLKSAVNEALTATLTVTVEETPDPVDLVALTYGYSDFTEITLTFAPTDASNPAVGVATVSGTVYQGWNLVEVTDTFNYTIVDGEFSATHIDGGSGEYVELILNDEYQFVVIDSYGWDTALTVVSSSEGGDGDATSVVAGTGSSAPYYITEAGTYSTTVTLAGGYFAIAFDDVGACEIKITYTIDDENIVAYYGSPRRPSSLVSGGANALDDVVYVFNFWFANFGDAPVDISFTVEIVPVTGA